MKRLTLTQGLLAVALCLSGSMSSAAPSCPADLTVCLPGKTGNGGCYRPMQSQCADGVVASDDLAVCIKGELGVGGVYDPHVQQCQAGAIYAQGQELCAGRDGRLTAFSPLEAACQQGRVIPIRRVAQPLRAPTSVQAGNLKDCPPGSKGPGGRYVPGFISCDQGFIH